MKQINRFMLSYALTGVFGALFALWIYAPLSGLLAALSPFRGLALIGYSTIVYLSTFILTGAYLFRRRLEIAATCIGVGIACLCIGVGGLMANLLPSPTLHRLSWLFVAFNVLEAVGFGGALVVVFTHRGERRAGGAA